MALVFTVVFLSYIQAHADMCRINLNPGTICGGTLVNRPDLDCIHPPNADECNGGSATCSSCGSAPAPTCIYYDRDGDGIRNNWEASTGIKISRDIFDDVTGDLIKTIKWELPCVVGNTLDDDPTGATVCPDPDVKDIAF